MRVAYNSTLKVDEKFFDGMVVYRECGTNSVTCLRTVIVTTYVIGEYVDDLMNVF